MESRPWQGSGLPWMTSRGWCKSEACGPGRKTARFWRWYADAPPLIEMSDTDSSWQVKTEGGEFMAVKTRRLIAKSRDHICLYHTALTGDTCSTCGDPYPEEKLGGVHGERPCRSINVRLDTASDRYYPARSADGAQGANVARPAESSQ